MELPGIIIRLSENALEERYFIPYSGSYEQLEADLDRLACQTAGGMLYLYVDHAIYGIDMNSRENMVVADSLAEGTFAVSSDKNVSRGRRVPFTSPVCCI